MVGLRGTPPAAVKLAVVLSTASGVASGTGDAFAELAQCPAGFYRTTPALFGCNNRHGKVHVLLGRGPSRIRVPAGVRDFQLEAQGPADTSLSVLDPSKDSELIDTTAGAAAVVWQGVQIRAHESPPRAEFVGSLPAPLVVVLARHASDDVGGMGVARLKYVFADFDGCKAVPVGCLPFERCQARDLVVRWSQWASTRYPTAKAAWQHLCVPLASEASPPGAVPFGLWDNVWAKWPDAAGQLPGWQAAFQFIDQCSGMPRDGWVDQADFGTAFRLAAVTVEISLWCQKLRDVHASPDAAWTATGGASDSIHGGITYSTWESRAWKSRGRYAEESFAYADKDGDNIVSRNEFAEIYESCNAVVSTLSPGAVMPRASTSLVPGMVPIAVPATMGARCFAYSPADLGVGEPNAFGDVVAQQWSLFLLDAFDSQDAFTWDVSTGGVSWSGSQIRFSGGGRSVRTMAVLYRSAGTIAISVKLTKAGLCDNHFVMLSTSAAESWSWQPSPSSVKFAWSCGSKYILSRNASASTACPSVGRYILSITLDPAGAMEFQDDRGCRDLILLDRLGASGEPLYLYIGGDGPPGNSSAFDEISVNIGINRLHASDIAVPTATACLYDGAQYEGPMNGGGGRTVEPSVKECQRRCSHAPGCAHFSFQLWSHSCDLFDGGARWHRKPGVISGPPRCIVGVQMQLNGIDSVQLTPFQRSNLALRLALELASAASLPAGAVKDASGTAQRVSLTKEELLACGFVSLPSGHSLAGIASKLAGRRLEEGVQASLATAGVSGSVHGDGIREKPHVRTVVWALPAAQCLLLGTAYTPSMHPPGLHRADNVSTCQAHCVRIVGCMTFTFHRRSGTCHLHNASALATWDEDAIAGPRVCAALPSVLEAQPGSAALKGLKGTGSANYRLVWGVLLLGLAGTAATAMLLYHFGLLGKRPAREGSAVYRPLSAEEAPDAAESRPPIHDLALIEQGMECTVSGTSGALSESEAHRQDRQDRHARISELFEALDTQHIGRLDVHELRRYADFCGFDGNDDEWVEEYNTMCCENGWNADAGMSLQQFQQLVNDDGKGYCTDEELTVLLEDLKSQVVLKGDSERSLSSGCLQQSESIS